MQTESVGVRLPPTTDQTELISGWVVEDFRDCGVLELSALTRVHELQVSHWLCWVQLYLCSRSVRKHYVHGAVVLHPRFQSPQCRWRPRLWPLAFSHLMVPGATQISV